MLCVPPDVVGSIFVETNVALGNLATSKKSGVCKCFVRSGSSVSIEFASMSMLTRLSSGLLFVRSIVPLNRLNEPLWLRVTFAATKSTFELSGEIVSVSAPAGLLEFVSGAAFETDALGLFAAGFAQANESRATLRIRRYVIRIYFVLDRLEIR